MTQFTPTRTFEGEVDGRRSRYLEGMMYTVRPGNTLLAAKLREWLDPSQEGGPLVALVSGLSALSPNSNDLVSATGTVTGTLKVGE